MKYHLFLLIGAILMNGTYGLAFLPVQRATLFTPDILDEPTPIVPFQQSTSHFYQDVVLVRLEFHLELGEIKHLP
jgi:hypothetical protein